MIQVGRLSQNESVLPSRLSTSAEGGPASSPAQWEGLPDCDLGPAKDRGSRLENWTQQEFRGTKSCGGFDLSRGDFTDSD